MAEHTPPQSPHHRREASTRSKSRFFDAFDTRHPSQSLQDVIRSLNLQFRTFTFHERACQYWLRQRKAVGRDKSIHRLGRSHQKPSRITEDHLNTLLHASKEVRSQPLPVQIQFYNLPTKKRNLQTQLRKRRKARRYKKAFVRAVSKINQRKRVEFATLHQGKTIDNFWQYIHFSDEAHIDPYQSSAEYILREEGTRFEPKNMQM